jgi:RNA polymerase sigma factor (sigma-70 family)
MIQVEMTPAVQKSWTGLVERIRRSEQGGLEDLYRLFERGVRFYLCRQLGPQDLNDRVHDAFLIVAEAIRKGELRDPERLMGYVGTVVRRQVAGQIERAVQSRSHQTIMDVGLAVPDRRPSPEQEAMERERRDIARQVLESASERDREILIRFYLREQRPEEICQAMNLTETQFRLLKSRAKARFGELGKRRLARRRCEIG